MKSICKAVLQIVLIVGTLVSAMQSSARATEITFLCAVALESWMVEVIPEFQKSSGYNVKPTFQIINDITERVRKGDAADLATVSTLQPCPHLVGADISPKRVDSRFDPSETWAAQDFRSAISFVRPFAKA